MTSSMTLETSMKRKGMTMHNLDYTRTKGSGYTTNEGKRVPVRISQGGTTTRGSARTISGGNKRR
jgi:hypothetical protein